MQDNVVAKTPNQLAKIYRVNVHKVLRWIARGELAAINVASTSTRPQWKILPEAIAAFEAARSATPKPAHARRRQPKKIAAVIEYF